MAYNPDATVLLYVEDEKLIQCMMIPALEDAGFEVLTADNGAQALDIIATEGGQIDALMTDVKLGKGPDGWNVARSARERMAKMPVIYASSVEEDEWMARGVPFSELIRKPFRPSGIMGAIAKFMANSGHPIHRKNL